MGPGGLYVGVRLSGLLSNPFLFLYLRKNVASSREKRERERKERKRDKKERIKKRMTSLRLS
jgi:hypothetical protein